MPVKQIRYIFWFTDQADLFVVISRLEADWDWDYWLVLGHIAQTEEVNNKYCESWGCVSVTGESWVKMSLHLTITMVTISSKIRKEGVLLWIWHVRNFNLILTMYMSLKVNIYFVHFIFWSTKIISPVFPFKFFLEIET